MKKKASKDSQPVKRCGVFDRDQSKKDGKRAMDVLWGIAKAAGSDLTVHEYEVATYEASLRKVEQELNSLTLPLGTKAALPHDMFEYTNVNETLENQ
jgi:hypothetical protein